MSGKVVELLKTLVGLRSPSGHEENVREFVIDYLEKAGLSPEVDEVGNVIVRTVRTVGAGEFWVTAHLDTVNTNYPFRHENGICYGTGVADDKASVAAMLLLARELGSDLNLNLAFFVDEEETGIGSQHFAEKERPGIAVVMEPTELKVCNQHWGVFEFFVTVRGKASHAAVPDAGINAIDGALKLVERLKDLSLRHGSIFNILSLESEPKDLYITPYECRLKAEFLLPESSRVVFEVMQLLEDYDYQILEVADPFTSGLSAEMLEEAIIASGMIPEKSSMPSWTDAVNLKKAGWDAVVFGPGSLATSHTERECVRVEEVVKAVEVLKNLSRIAASTKSHKILRNA